MGRKRGPPAPAKNAIVAAVHSSEEDLPVTAGHGAEKAKTRSGRPVNQNDLKDLLNSDVDSEDDDGAVHQAQMKRTKNDEIVLGPKKKNELESARDQKNQLARQNRQILKGCLSKKQSTQSALLDSYLDQRDKTKDDTFVRQSESQNSDNAIPNDAEMNKKIAEQENLLLQKNNLIDVLESKNAELMAIVAGLETDRDELTRLNADFNTRLSSANSKYLALRSEIEAERIISVAIEKSGMGADCVQSLVDSIQSIPVLIDKLNASVAEAQAQLIQGPTTGGTLDDSMLPEPSEEIVTERQAEINVPSDDIEKWQYFREKVSWLKSFSKDDYLYALVHKEAEPGLYDIGKGNGILNKFFASKTLLQRAIENSKEIHQYALQAFEAFFKTDVALFCTCNGTSKGYSADGHDRAGLPKDALEVFLDHCIRVGKKANWSVAGEKETKKNLRHKINVHLNSLRKKYKFEPTPAQLADYNLKMKRGAGAKSVNQM